ncbi:unnamed protein product [Lupinus luteus]|uniref:Uncharacterized protein n=1 Tax=Lupinus luteus TaxID=3873 RepID=A0AAV1X5L7_LUPLU
MEMTPQEENPPPPPMDSEKTNTEADNKPFSIRGYVFSWRQKNMLNSWPFSEKSLQMCLKEGLSINDILPPFHEPHNQGSSNLLHLRHDDNKKDVNNHSQNVTNECNLLSNDASYEDGNQPAEDAIILLTSNDNVDASNPTLASLKARRIRKCKRGRGRRKIRLMRDILAEAKHCTLDNQY